MLINTKNELTSVVSTFHILTHPHIYHVYIYYGNPYRFRLPMTKLATGKISGHPLVAFLQAACHEGFLGIPHRSLVLHIPVTRGFLK